MSASAKRIPSSHCTCQATPTCASNDFTTLRGLKARTYRTWRSLTEAHGQCLPVLTPVTDEDFKRVVRQSGDLRRKSTWQNAWAALYAQLILETLDDNEALLQRTFARAPVEEGWLPLLPLVLENFLQYPSSFRCLENGIQRIWSRYGKFPPALEPLARALESSPTYQMRQATPALTAA